LVLRLSLETKASIKNLRMSPRKVRLVADLVRRLSVDEALHALQFSSKRAAVPLKKLLESAIANAKESGKLAKEDLEIAELRVDEAPTLKRMRFVSRGRVHRIRKRASHVELVLKQKEKPNPQKLKTKNKKPKTTT
jgi:large subunit ribosomal protein L22